MSVKVKICRCLIVSALFAFGLCGCEKDKLDRQMAALCQQDGGSKVYEKVVLPADMFADSGRPLFGWGPNEGKLDKEYIYLSDEQILKDGDPLKGEGRLLRYHVKIIRRSDNKLLGEEIYYRRAGGDGFYIGHYTQNVCPNTTVHVDRMVFINSKTVKRR